MSVDMLRPTLGAHAVVPKQDANGQSGRDPRQDGKHGKSEREQADQPDPFLNCLGQLTGSIINITA